MESIGVERSIWIAAPIERAWSAITDPAQLTQWYATYFKWEIPELKVGGRIKFHNSASEVLQATIEVVDPPRQFRLRWDSYENGTTLVTAFLLAEENNGTRATLVETGYETLPADERQQWLEATGAGYTMSMENLKAFVEGRSLPH